MESIATSRPLSQLHVLVVDCQATAAAPRGHLLEIGWAVARNAALRPDARLIALPSGERIPLAVSRITGITDRMARTGVDPLAAWSELASAAATLALQPAPTVIHFARFETPFLYRIAGGAPPLDVVCTHDVARRLLPDLPRRGLRALAGYFGRAVGTLRRSADHVNATAFVWHELVRLLEAEGISTWGDLGAWLTLRGDPPRPRRRVWPMPRDLRLSLPDAPGVYRMLRTSGDVLYVGKAASLRDRVNSYFRHQRGVPDRLLEMLSQARGISFATTPSALEAALLEPDEIKRHRPPYNIALTERNRGTMHGSVTGAPEERHVWFASRDLSDHAAQPSARFPVGPFPSAEILEQFASLARARRASLGRGRWAPDGAIFRDGYALFCSAHVEMSGNGSTYARMLRLGTRLWREGRRDRDGDDDPSRSSRDRPVAVWTPDYVQLSLEWLVLRAALAWRRAAWLTRLADASVAWREPGASQSRVIVMESGEVAARACIDPDTPPPIPPGFERPAAARHEALTVARFDRLRVLTTELKRLTAAGGPVSVRFGAASLLADARLAAVLAWL